MKTLTWPKDNNLFIPSGEIKRETQRIQVPEHCLYTFNQLDQMMDELLKAGVDVSYFPKQATDILRKYAIKMTPQPGAIPTPFTVYDTTLKQNNKNHKTLIQRGETFIKTIITKLR